MFIEKQQELLIYYVSVKRTNSIKITRLTVLRLHVSNDFFSRSNLEIKKKGFNTFNQI